MASSKWNDIYIDNRIHMKEYCDNNQKKYNEMKPEHYKTLDACVDYAIENGDHAAFVHFFMEKAKSQKEVFCSILWEYLDEYNKMRERNKELPTWGKFRILDADYWRTYNFECSNYTEEELKKYCYSVPTLSNWKNIGDKNIKSHFFLNI